MNPTQNSSPEETKLNVFIADDSPDVLDRITNMVCQLHGVAMAGQAVDTQGAIEGIRYTNPDVIILDIRMPGGGGIEVLKEIKTGTKSPMVIILTAFPHQQYQKKCLELGADYFFDKTEDMDKVLEIISKKSQAKRNNGFIWAE